MNYLGYLGHNEDVIITEPIEVAEEVEVEVVKENVDSDSNIKELDEEGQWVIAGKRSGRVSNSNKKWNKKLMSQFQSFEQR